MGEPHGARYRCLVTPSRRPRRSLRGRLWALALLALAGGWLGASAPRSAAQAPSVLVTVVADPITPVIADHLREGVERAEAGGHEAFLVELDTPGGLDTSMRDIVQAFLGARVPVVVYVAPAGARAASAGAIITFAAHFAAMAPGTAIGAATPVSLEDGAEVSDKIVNDAAAYAEAIAELRGRNVEFAVDTVREGRSAAAEEAVEIGAVDLLAESRSELLAAIDGTEVEVADGGRVTIRTAGADVAPYEMGTFRRILQWLADPNLAFLFLSIGTLAIIYELANPGIGAGGITGTILILLALFSLSVLPVNAAAAILLVLAAALFVAELFVPGVGVFAAGGVVSLVLGGFFLFRGSVDVAPAVLYPTGLVVGAGVILAGRIAWKSRRAPVVSGTEAMVGRPGRVGQAAGTSGQVLVDGVWWRARTDGEPLREGQRVRVRGIEGLELIVEPEAETEKGG